MLLEIFTMETSFHQVYIDRVHFCNCIFLIKCFHNKWNPLNGEMKPFNLKNIITEMYIYWKLISVMNIYLNCLIFTCARPFNSSRRGTVNNNQPHSAAVSTTELRPVTGHCKQTKHSVYFYLLKKYSSVVLVTFCSTGRGYGLSNKPIVPQPGVVMGWVTSPLSRSMQCLDGP